MAECLCPNHVAFSKHVCPCSGRMALAERVIEAARLTSQYHQKENLQASFTRLDEALVAYDAAQGRGRE